MLEVFFSNRKEKPYLGLPLRILQSVTRSQSTAAPNPTMRHRMGINPMLYRPKANVAA